MPFFISAAARTRAIKLQVCPVFFMKSPIACNWAVRDFSSRLALIRFYFLEKIFIKILNAFTKLTDAF